MRDGWAGRGCHGAGRSSGGRLLENEHRIRHFLTQSHGARAAWGAEALCPLQGAAKAAQGAAHAERPGKGRPVRTVEGRGLRGGVPEAAVVDTDIVVRQAHGLHGRGEAPAAVGSSA